MLFPTWDRLAHLPVHYVTGIADKRIHLSSKLSRCLEVALRWTFSASLLSTLQKMSSRKRHRSIANVPAPLWAADTLDSWAPTYHSGVLMHEDGRDLLHPDLERVQPETDPCPSSTLTRWKMN
jgi:hypothetical protein